MSAAAAAARGGVDEDSTMFFPGPNSASARTAERAPGRAPGRNDGVGPSAFDAPAFDPLDDPKAGDPAASLAARAEPLAAAKGGPDRSRGGRPAPSAKGGAGARGGRAAAKGARGGGTGSVPRTAASRSASKSRKPKEPSTLLLGLGLGAVILAGIAAAYLLTRGGDETEAVAPDTSEVIEEESTASTGPDSEAITDADVAGPETTTPPVVEFDAAAVGPIMAGTEYTINVAGGPTDANYQLLIDGVAAAEPAPQLAPVVFAPGRHLVEVAISSASGDTATPPVVVYAAEEAAPGVVFRANLASINTDPNIEGWAEAVRRFDEYVAAGHTDLQLLPSDWYPSLTAGYWNIFVGGFGTAAEAEAYCEGFGLAIPDQCFPVRFDPDAPAGG